MVGCSTNSAHGQCSSISQYNGVVIPKTILFFIFSKINNERKKWTAETRQTTIACKLIIPRDLGYALHRSAGTRLASINLVCRRFDTASDTSEHGEVHTDTAENDCDVAWCRLTTSGSSTTTTTTPVPTPDQSRSLEWWWSCLHMYESPRAVPGGRSCQKIREKETWKRRGSVRLYRGREILANA